MNLKYLKTILLLSVLISLFACGDRDDGQVSKGHRDAMKEQCKDASDTKACGLELRKKFLSDGNEFVNLSDLSKSEIKKIKLECMRTKTFGLVSYNDCLADYKQAALDGELWEKTEIVKKPTNHIDKLQQKTVRVDIVVQKKDSKDLMLVGGGSGVIIKDNLVVTNCHVTNAFKKRKEEKKVIFIKAIDIDKYARAKIYKEKQENDICIIKKEKDAEFGFPMVPVKKLVKFSKLNKGDFVRTFGSPVASEGSSFFEGHTADGSINYLGTSKEANYSWLDELSPDTKLIIHSATMNFGSSGGPLFDKNGNLIGINSSGTPDGKFNVSVSADHIKELLDRK